MKEYLKILPLQTRKIINLVTTLSKEKNIQTYLVGGFVRDLFLRRKNLDIDIAIESEKVLELAAELAKCLHTDFLYHEKFNTATLNYQFGKLDLAMTRKEYYSHPGSLPRVFFGSIRDDLFRRDFTINAMAIKLDEDELVDFFEGKADLEKRLIRVLHPESFIDDPTRVFRAIRFEQRYGFKIEENTFKLLKEAIKKDMFKMVSKQRIFNELIISLKEKDPLRQILRMKNLIGWQCFDTEINPDIKVLRRIENQYHWYISNNRKAGVNLWFIYLIALLDGLEFTRVRDLINTIPLSKEWLKKILDYKKIDKEKLVSLCKKEIDPFEIYSILNSLSLEALLFLKAKCLNPNFQKNLIDFLNLYRNVNLYVSGSDLKKLGIKPGPKYREIFDILLRHKLKGKIKTRQEELEFVKNNFLDGGRNS